MLCPLCGKDMKLANIYADDKVILAEYRCCGSSEEVIFHTDMMTPDEKWSTFKKLVLAMEK